MRFSIRDLLLVTVIVALAAGWWVDRRRQAFARLEEFKKVEEVAQALPFKVQRFFANGQVSTEWWERRTIDGGTEPLRDLGTIRFYSNGAKATEYYSGDEKLSRYYSPGGKLISRAEWHDLYLRDLGDGTFAKSLPSVDGRPSPLATDYPERPKSL